MQNYCKTIGVLAAATALVAGNAMAEVEYELHTGYTSDYLYRGVIIGNNLIETGADVKADLGGVALSAGAWYGSFTNDGDNANEMDLYTEVSKDLDFLKVSVGYIYRLYDFGGNDNNVNFCTQEVYAGMSKDLGFAELSMTYYWGVEGNDQSYAGGMTEGYTELGLRRSIEINPCLSLNLGTNVGYLVEGGDFTAWTTKVALDWGFAEHAKLSPFGAMSIAMGESTRSLWSSTENEFVAGSMLSVTF
ncbi:MAG: hypothetical protein RLZZ282_1310 [Verrucomicrobiota bacterium]|jgi:hypothetical protein